MSISQGYVLLLGGSNEASHPIYYLLKQHHCPVFVACSAAQAVARIEQSSPYLMILSGSRQNWAPTLVHHLRQRSRSVGVTIVALTDLGELGNRPLEEHPDLDGFLVQPLSDDVLTSVLESALVKTDF